MEKMNTETVKFILDNIDKSNKRLKDLDELIENYKFQIESVGKSSSLGQEFSRNLSFLKGERNRLNYQIEDLKQHLVGINLEDYNLKEENSEKEEQETNEEIEESEELVLDDEQDIVEEELNEELDLEQEELTEEINDIKEDSIEETENQERLEDSKEDNNVLENDYVQQTNSTQEEQNNTCDYYKISCVAAFVNGRILDALFIEDENDINNTISQLYSEYGNEIEIKLNYDGYKEGNSKPVYENIGWLDLNDYLGNAQEQQNTNSDNQTQENNNSVYEDKIEEEINYQEDSIYETEEIIQENTSTDYNTKDVNSYEFNDIDSTSEKNKLYNVKVLYKRGKYKIDFDIIEDGEVLHRTYENKMSFKALYSSLFKEEMANEYGIDTQSFFYKNMDTNLLLSLKEIDKEYGTEYVKEYINDELNIKIKYDLKDLYEDKNLKFTDKLFQRKVALRQTKISDATILGSYNKGLFVGAVASLVLITTLGISNIIPSFGKKNKKDVAENKKNVEKQVTTEELTTEQIVEKIVNKTKKKENVGLGINDSLALINKDENGNIKYTYKLSKDAEGNGEKLLASDYSDCDKFKISSIAVYKEGSQLLMIDNANNDENLKTEELYDKYGEEIDIKLNFDAYKENSEKPDYKNIGWLSLNDFKSGESNACVKNLEEAKTEIEKENAANDIVEREASVSSNEKYEYCNFGLDDKISLFYKDSNGNVTSSQVLSSDAWGNGKTFDASRLDCDYFRISYMAVYSGSDVIDIREIKDGDSVDDITNSMYQNYGADIDIAFNFNGYYNDQDEKDTPYKNVGWLNINKIVNLNEKLKESISGNTNTVTPKVYKK